MKSFRNDKVCDKDLSARKVYAKPFVVKQSPRLVDPGPDVVFPAGHKLQELNP